MDISKPMRLADAIKRTSVPNELRPDPDYRVTAAPQRSVKIRLAPGVIAKTGTPLKRMEDGTYSPSSDEDAVLIAATFGYGCQDIHAHRSMTIDVYRNPRESGHTGWYEGDRLRTESLDANGKPTFVRDPEGTWYAISETIVEMNCSTKRGG